MNTENTINELKKLDTQQVELVGRNFLVSMFIADNVEVALPLRDRGVDLIAFVDVDSAGKHRAVPVQLKSSSARMFSVQKKYKKFPNMLMAYVWFAAQPQKTELYVMTYTQAEELAEKFGWTKNEKNWIEKGDKGGFSTSKPSDKHKQELQQYRYKPGMLAELVKSSN